MSLSITSGYVAPAPLTQNIQSSQVNNASDPDGDGDGGGGRAHKSRSGGHMHQAMLQALQSMGLALPQQTSSTTAASQTATSTDSDGDSDGSTSATSSVKNDMRQFMHALFQAVKTETTSGTGNPGSSSTDPKANFAAGLSALITQVSNGSAPADLQNAFSQLASDLQPTSSTTSGISAASSSSATSANPAQATLQALLTQLQQNLGYGGSSLAAVGNIVSTQA